MTLPAFTLLAPANQAAAPFTMGQPIRQGEVPAGQNLLCAGASSFQSVIKNAWPDGSAKFAVISGRADLTGGTPLPLTLTAGTPAAGTALTTSDLMDTFMSATVDVGTLGQAAWTHTDFAVPFMTWVTGPVMSSWIYRKPVGTDPHLVAWLEIRLYAGGRVEVLPWVENGYINVAAPTNKLETYKFSLNGVERFSKLIDLKHHQRTVLISGTMLSYWLGADPGVLVKHDTTYFQATELVPTYSARPASTLPNDRYSIAGFEPLQQGDFKFGASATGNGGSDNMADTGYSRCIGLLPEWDVLHLTVNTENTFNLVVRNAYSAGRYGIHYRDEATNRPLRFSQFPWMTIDNNQGFNHNGSSVNNTHPAVATGGNPPWWDTAHSPAIGFMAYLVTGRFYFMEEVQFVATANYLGNGSGPELRDGSKGLTQPCVGAWQIRDCAWMWRSLAHALCATPDNDTALQTEFKNSVQSNIDHFYNRYVAQTNNPFGFIQSGAAYGNEWGTIPVWQQDFVTASFGYSLCMGLPLTGAYSTKLSQFFQWTAKSITGRMATFAENGWPYVNAGIYLLSISAANVPNWANGTGPWRANWGEIYAAQSFVQSTSGGDYSWRGTVDGVLKAESFSNAVMSQWGNLTPALAYAVRHQVPGASTGLARVQSASNYTTLATQFNTWPVWSVAPATNEAPVEPPAPTPGERLIIDSTELTGAGTLVIGEPGFGILGKNVVSQTGTGTSGGGVLVNDLDAGDDEVELMAEMVTPPSAGKMVLFPDGRFSFTDAPDGSYSFTYRLKAAGVDRGTTAVSMLVGVASTTANVQASAIVSTQQFGVPVVQTSVAPSTSTTVQTFAIANSEAFGLPTVTATAPSTGGGGMVLSEVEQRQMYEWVRALALINGLVQGEPVTVQKTRRIAGDVEQEILGAGSNSVVVNRV